MKAEVLDRINVQNNPVNWIDPYGLTDDFVKALTGQGYSDFMTGGLEADFRSAEQFNKNLDQRIRAAKNMIKINSTEADIIGPVRDAVGSVPPSDGGAIDTMLLVVWWTLDDEVVHAQEEQKKWEQKYSELKNIPKKVPQLEQFNKLNNLHSAEHSKQCP